MAIMRFSKQIVIVYRDSVNRLIFVVETRCVIFEVGTDVLSST
jgi:hypothetical protein